MQCRGPGFDPWVGKIPWRRERLTTAVFWPGEFHGPYSPWGHKELEMTVIFTLRRLAEVMTNGSCCSVTKSHLTLCITIGCGHARLLCPPLSSGVCSNSCPLTCCCHPTILSSVTPFSFCLQAFPVSGSFPMN